MLLLAKTIGLWDVNLMVSACVQIKQLTIWFQYGISQIANGSYNDHGFFSHGFYGHSATLVYESDLILMIPVHSFTLVLQPPKYDNVSTMPNPYCKENNEKDVNVILWLGIFRLCLFRNHMFSFVKIYQRKGYNGYSPGSSM